ncbi:MAG: helix-turn-helix transcriptional regulator [Methanobrevibacter sp.]|nr:helix-turn-helix transcriptional regulator [Methanobrevibacter sp.]
MMPLQKYVEKYNIEVADLCRHCGISRTAYYNIISGRSSPRVDTAVKIKEYLKFKVSVYESLNIEYLFTDWDKRFENISIRKIR